MNRTRPVHRFAVTMNGIGIAYALALVNSLMAVVNSFGLQLTDTQRVSIVGLVNASLVLAVHLSHRLGEVQAAGGSGQLSRAQTAEILSEAAPPPVAAPKG